MTGKLKAPKRAFPTEARVDGQEFTFKLMDRDDREALLEFSQSLPSEDLTFLRMDITKPEVVDDWLDRIDRGRTISILALDAGENVVGYATLHHNEMLWTRHLGEIRLLVRSDLRGIGLGKRLTHEIFQVAGEQHLTRLIVNIPRDRPHVRQMLERLGFHAEALLTDWLMSADGKTHDMLVMSHFIDE